MEETLDELARNKRRSQLDREYEVFRNQTGAGNIRFELAGEKFKNNLKTVIPKA